MKYLKTLGLAAVAAMALTVFLGAGSASASVLCTTTSTPCGTGWHVDELVLSSFGTTSTHSTGGALEATCVGSSLSVTKVVTGSSTNTPVFSSVLGLFWSGCSQTTDPDTISGGEIEIHQISGTDNGTVTARGFATTIVIAGVSCVYTAAAGTDLGVLTGGAFRTLHINAVLGKKSGSFLCPTDTIWEGAYTVTNHTAVYVETS